MAASLDFEAPRVNLMTALAGLWGIRLTFNLARKGGYRPGSEDYRWRVLRERLGPLRFQMLNITFIAPGQMLVVWLFTSPVHRAWLRPEAPLGWLDLLAAALFLSLLAVETVADEQMWAFQQDKKRRVAAGEAVVEPFLTTGLFRYSRHPNYLGDIGQWWAFSLFAVAASGEWLHWTGWGFVAVHGGVPRGHPAHRIHFGGKVSRLPRVPGEDADAPSRSAVVPSWTGPLTVFARSRPAGPGLTSLPSVHKTL